MYQSLTETLFFWTATGLTLIGLLYILSPKELYLRPTNPEATARQSSVTAIESTLIDTLKLPTIPMETHNVTLDPQQDCHFFFVHGFCRMGHACTLRHEKTTRPDLSPTDIINLKLDSILGNQHLIVNFISESTTKIDSLQKKLDSHTGELKHVQNILTSVKLCLNEAGLAIPLYKHQFPGLQKTSLGQVSERLALPKQHESSLTPPIRKTPERSKVQPQQDTATPITTHNLHPLPTDKPLPSGVKKKGG